MTTEPVLDQVISDLRLSDTPAQLARRTSVVHRVYVYSLSVSAEDRDPVRARQIVDDLIATATAAEVRQRRQELEAELIRLRAASEAERNATDALQSRVDALNSTSSPSPEQQAELTQDRAALAAHHRLLDPYDAQIRTFEIGLSVMTPLELVTVVPDPPSGTPLKPRVGLSVAAAAVAALILALGIVLLSGAFRGRLAMPRRAVRVPAAGLAAGAGAALVGWAVSSLTWSGAFLPLVLLAAGIMVAVALWDWRWGVLVLLAYVPFDGLFTMPLYPMTLPILRYVILGAVYLGFLRALLTGRVRWPLAGREMRPFLALGALCVLDTINPHGIHLLVAGLGAAALTAYLPMYVVARALARQPGMLAKAVAVVLATSLPVAAFGIWEWHVGPSVVEGWGPSFEKWIWVIGPEGTSNLTYRPASTFHFVAEYANYLVFVTVLAVASVHMPQRLWRRLALGALTVILMLALVTEAARTSWVMLPVLVVGMYVVNPRIKMLRITLPAAAAALAIVAFIGSSSLHNRLPSLLDGRTFIDRWDQTALPLRAHFLSWDALWGHGTGTALGASRYVTGGVPTAFESGWYAPFFMFGIWGLIAVAWLYVFVLSRAWEATRRMPSGRRWVGAVIFVFLLVNAVVNSDIASTPVDLYFWFFAGLLGGLAVPLAARSAAPAEPIAMPATERRAVPTAAS